MRSDGVVDSQPLGKCNCLSCGSVFRSQRALSSGQADANPYPYTLNAGAETSFDVARHAGYAQAIQRAVDRAPTSVLDVGCGNGALLEQLRAAWPFVQARGIEPAPLPRLEAGRRGLDVRAALDERTSADLVLSVNVIEHTLDPAAFLRGVARSVQPFGNCVLIWPDDQTPSSELLFNDHLFTLSATTVRSLAAQAGLTFAGIIDAPAGFQGLILKRPSTETQLTRSPHGPTHEMRALAGRRAHYLLRWSGLDEQLLRRVDSHRILIGFGVGEAAQLLRAYAPGLWGHIAGLSADECSGGEALGLPLYPPSKLDPQHHQILLATHPRSHAQLLGRFTERGYPCIAWNDLIES